MHRDLKPENILCGEELDDLKIADFGLSKMVSCRCSTTLQAPLTLQHLTLSPSLCVCLLGTAKGEDGLRLRHPLLRRPRGKTALYLALHPHSPILTLSSINRC